MFLQRLGVLGALASLPVLAQVSDYSLTPAGGAEVSHRGHHLPQHLQRNPDGSTTSPSCPPICSNYSATWSPASQALSQTSRGRGGSLQSVVPLKTITRNCGLALMDFRLATLPSSSLE